MFCGYPVAFSHRAHLASALGSLATPAPVMNDRSLHELACPPKLPLALGRLIAARKPFGGSRGLVVGDLLWHVVARTVAQQFSKPLDAACKPHQCALSTRAGAEAPRLRPTPSLLSFLSTLLQLTTQQDCQPFPPPEPNLHCTVADLLCAALSAMLLLHTGPLGLMYPWRFCAAALHSHMPSLPHSRAPAPCCMPFPA